MITLPTTARPVELNLAAALSNARFWDAGPARMEQRRRQWPDAIAADPESPHLLPNSATLTRPLAAEDAGDVVSLLREFYAAGTGAQWVLWSAWPTPDLAQHGLVHWGEPPIMVRQLWEAPIRNDPPELTIVEAVNERDVHDWNQVLIDGYPLPELREAGIDVVYDGRILGSWLRLFVGYVDGEPVSCSAAIADESVTGIFAVATVPSRRGRGYGAALVEAAANSEPSLPAMLAASDLGFPVYERIGFKTVGRFTLWIGDRSR
jgi:GNAT superfamily N-acetyltransferase